MLPLAKPTTDSSTPTDDEIVARVLAGAPESFEVLMRRHNQRLFRAARSVLRDEFEAEDVVQDAWVRAYANLQQFAGRASFATWATRIALHEAFARRRQRALHATLAEPEAIVASDTPAPDEAAGAREVAKAIEAAIDTLPMPYRTVFMLRDVEGLGTTETAVCLDIPEATVKTRLHRARGLLRSHLHGALDVGTVGIHAFAGARCDRIVAAVMARIGAERPLAINPS